jgi:hypothetical protein
MAPVPPIARRDRPGRRVVASRAARVQPEFMKDRQMNRTLTATLASAATIGLAVAAPAMSMTSAPLPPEHVDGAVTYRSGGVGNDEAMTMKHAEGQYPLAVEFVRHAKPADQHLASVDLTIKDAKGNTQLAANGVGPFVLAKLPAGKYTVIATDNGQTKTRNVVIAANKPERLTFEW